MSGSPHATISGKFTWCDFTNFFDANFNSNSLISVSGHCACLLVFLKFVKLLQVNATSESSQRSALKAVLWGGSAWTAENSDFDQHLTVDLGTIKNITGIATQGRAHVDEYVMEFRIQYGSNGKDFIGKGPFFILLKGLGVGSWFILHKMAIFPYFISCFYLWFFLFLLVLFIAFLNKEKCYWKCWLSWC